MGRVSAVSIIAAKYNIFPHADKGRSEEKIKILAKRFAHAISEHYRDLKHAYTYAEFDCAALLAML